MNFSVILFILANILKVEGLLLVLPFIVSIIYKESSKNIFSFLTVIAILLSIGFLATMKRPKKMSMQAKDGFVIVALSWIFLSFFGALPFVLSGQIPSLIDAFFETASGFTTTGSSILQDVESLSHSMLFWRSFTHLIGGMGVLVFALAVLPASGLESVHVMKAEVPGPVFGKLVAKMRVTARILYGIYLLLTGVLVLLLFLGGMSLFDSVVHAFGAAGTGGFGIKANSVAYYTSSYIHVVLGIAMLVFSVNFNLYYLVMIGQGKKILESEEFRLFAFIVVSAITMIFIDIGKQNGFSIVLLRDVFFQVASIISTTGYSTVDFDKWPLFSKIVLISIMFIGGCAGSTAGGLKVSRIGILFRTAMAELKRVVQPNRVITVKYEKKALDEVIISSVLHYFVIYIMVFVALLLIVSLDSDSFMTAFSAVSATFNNIGPGFDRVGPMSNFSGFSNFTKIVLSFSMIFGRLEIYPMLILMGGFFRKLDLK